MRLRIEPTTTVKFKWSVYKNATNNACIHTFILSRILFCCCKMRVTYYFQISKPWYTTHIKMWTNGKMFALLLFSRLSRTDCSFDLTWRVLTRPGVFWLDLVCFNLTWCVLTWLGVPWHDLVFSCWLGVSCLASACHDQTWCVLTWFGVSWPDLACCDLTWCDMIWHGVFWLDLTCLHLTWRVLTWLGVS